jgi:hypothetical protein
MVHRSTAWESHHHAWEKSNKLPYVEQPADVVHVMLDAIQSVDYRFGMMKEPCRQLSKSWGQQLVLVASIPRPGA